VNAEALPLSPLEGPLNGPTRMQARDSDLQPHLPRMVGPYVPTGASPTTGSMRAR
jgi:hypothetical protein